MSKTIVFISDSRIPHHERQRISVALASIASRFATDRSNLYIDLSSRGTTTALLTSASSVPDGSVAEALRSDHALQSMICPSVIRHLDLIAGGPGNSPLHVPLPVRPDAQQALAQALDPIADRYSYLFIDCPSSLSLLTVNALSAADAFVCVLGTDMSEAATLRMKRTMRNVRRRVADTAPVLGVIGFLAPPDTHALDAQYQLLLHHFGGKTLFMPLPESDALTASGDGQPAPEDALDVYQLIADDLMDRLRRYHNIGQHRPS